MSARFRALRERAGLTQGELASRAGVSRQLVGAAESGRNLPRVDAALAIAGALGVDVADLFGDMAPPADVLTGDLPDDGTLVRAGRVGDRVVTVRAGIGIEGWETADGRIDRGALTSFARRRPGIVVAGCEPGLEVLEHILREGAMSALAVPSSSTAAIEVLDGGRLHAAVVHGPVGAVGGRVGGRSIDRYRLTRWRVGLAAPAGAGTDWWREALGGTVPVVQREAGAGVQRTFEEAAGPNVPGPRVGTHLAAARRAVLSGTAAVTIEPAAVAVGAAFHPLDVHEAELWFDRVWATDRVVGDALEVITGRRFQQRLAAVGGYDLVGCGDRVA